MSNKEINEQWSRSSENYDRIIHDELKSFRPEQWQKRILSRFPGQNKLRILDVGCGPAFFTIILAAKGHEVVGIDGAEGMLEKARENVERSGVKADILEMDGCNLSFPDDYFDLIISRNVTHALQNHVTAYTEWKRALKQGGILLIYDANWHLVRCDEKIRAQYLADVKRCISVFGSDFNGHTDPGNCSEAVCDRDKEMHKHILGDLHRPDYDVGILSALGYKNIEYDRNIIEGLWDDKEKTIYGTTPMFEISAVK